MDDLSLPVDPKVRFLLSVPDWTPKEASPFQGFSMSLCRNRRFLRFVYTFPTDIFELTPASLPSRIGRRIAGQLPIEWHGQSPHAIKFMPAPIEMPFTVVILDESEKVADYQEWLDKSPGPVTIVAKDEGHIPYDKLSFDTLRGRFLEVCDELGKHPNLEGVAEAKAAIEAWEFPVERELPYKLGGHGTILPNLAALGVCGFGSLVEGPFTRHGDEAAHIAQIVQTCNSVLDERGVNPPSKANRLFPRTPDLNLYLPSTYDLKSVLSPRAGIDPATRRGMMLTSRIIEKQDSYSFNMTTPAQIKAMIGIQMEELKAGAEPVVNPIMRIRQMEVNLGTEVVSCLAASEISAVIRIPNRMNRTKSIVRSFAQHYRADRPQLRKRAELFRGVQKAIRDGFPDEFFQILDRSSDGIRIIADAHIEWLDVRGIPLGLRYNVSRVPVTPGNLFIDSVGMKEPLFVPPDAFEEILVISGLEKQDTIAKQFQLAFSHFGELWGKKIKLRFVRVKTRREMVDSINAFRGMLMVFDGHGSHRIDEPGVLWLGDEPVNVWELRGEITRPPPVVLLSACDTHAADRNHATVANGFLMLGTRSVIGTVFPLHATHAAIFAARLIYRVSEFIPAALEMFGRSITWLEVVSGMLRRQALTDILHHLEKIGLVPDNWSVNAISELHMLVDVSGPDPFASVQFEMAKWGFPKEKIEREIHIALASSSTISYLHLGRPETIIINSMDNMRKTISENQE